MRKIMQWVMIVALIGSTCVLTSYSNNDHEAGVVKIQGGDVERGIWVSPEMKDLYQCLQASGIDTYVCSASLELIVEELACDSVLGFGLPAERVYGLRFVTGEKIIAQFDSEYK